jgi:hypothetical protein
LEIAGLNRFVINYSFPDISINNNEKIFELLIIFDDVLGQIFE